MRSFWREKGKRIVAFLLALLVVACAIPTFEVDLVVTQAEETVAVTVSGTVKVLEDGAEEVYEGASVTVEYPNSAVSGETIVSAPVETLSDGTYAITITDWTMEENQEYIIEVTPKDGDSYEVGSVNGVVSADNITASALTIQDIVLEESAPAIEYTITVPETVEGGLIEIKDANDAVQNSPYTIVEGEKVYITATPNEGYEVSEVMITKDGSDWMPDGETEENWWDVTVDAGKNWKVNESGTFTYVIDAVDADYEFTISYEKKEFAIAYTIDVNGKLVLNSSAANDADKIEVVGSGSESVEYTTDAYEVNVSVTDEGYHLTEVTIDGVSVLTTEDTEKNNDLEEKSYIFVDGITEVHEIVVTIGIDTYAVSVECAGNGSVTVDGGNLENNTAQAAPGDDIIFVATPVMGYQVAGISVVTINEDGTENTSEEVEYIACVDNGNGSYNYTLEDISCNQKVVFTFEEIEQTENPPAVKIMDGNGEEVEPDSDGKYYGEEFKLSVEGKLLRIGENDTYGTEVMVSSTCDVASIYIRDNAVSDFGQEEKISVTPAITLVIDREVPAVKLSNESMPIWMDKADTQVTVAGTVVLGDDNAVLEQYPDYVVWSSVSLDEAGVIASGNKVSVNTDSSFSVELPLGDGGEIDHLYLYAVDKVGHCSAAKDVVVHRDQVAPVITDVAITPVINRYVFGNFYNNSITLNITAHDAQSDVVSGISQIYVYTSDMSQIAYAGTVENAVVGSTSDTITLTIPVGDTEAFANLTELQIVAVDARNVASAPYKMEDFVSLGTTNNGLMLEGKSPKITVEPVGTGFVINEGSEVQNWYKTVPNMSYVVTETGSGLKEGTISLNGTNLDSYAKTYSTDVSFADVIKNDNATISAQDLSDMSDGENVVKATFADFAGNQSSTERKIYIDSNAPRITEFSIEKKSNAGKLNFIGFGNYANTTVSVTVHAEDAVDMDNNTIPSAGVKNITLYLDGVAFKTVAANANDVDYSFEATFALPEEVVDAVNGKVYLDAKITASVTDNVNNTSEIVDMTTINSNLSSDLMIETVAPKIKKDGLKFTSTGTTTHRNVNDEGIVELYYQTNAEFVVPVQDGESGLFKSIFRINGDTVRTVPYTGNASLPTMSDVQNFNTVDLNLGIENEITITVIDNAGNAIEETAMLYHDADAPKVTLFEMSAAGNVEADGLPVIETDYGYYFREDTKVTVTVTDELSGVAKVQWYRDDITSGKSEVKVAKKVEENKYTFTVPAQFKGQIYVNAIDNLGNNVKDVHPNGVIIETAEQHASEKHTTFTAPKTSFKDKKEKPLYANDVTLEVTVADTYSGIRSVEWSVEAPYDTEENQKGVITIDNKGSFESGAQGWKKVKTEANLVTEIKKSLTVTNNSNDIVVTIKLTDRSGNVSEDKYVLSIDKTKPIIAIEFDGIAPDAEYTNVYKEQRTATITVTERNFDANNFVINVTSTEGGAQISDWETLENTNNPDATTTVATVTFAEDGDYTLEVSGQDMAQNIANSEVTEEFTIDKTLPVIDVTYNNTTAINGNYYAQEQVVTIVVTEHNFAEERVEVLGTATVGGAETAFPTISGWNSDGDVHTATISFSEDALYRFDIHYSDQAGNEAENYVGEEFYVDMTVPEIEITGVENLSANNGDVIPRISLTDENYNPDGVSIQLIGANNGAVSMDGGYAEQANGQVYTYNNFPKEQENDDIYTLSVTLTDMAENETTEEITFSVNRFGSVYVFDDTLKEIAGAYVQEEIDVVLTEVNVDSLEHESIKVVVDTNGTPKTLTEGTDYSVSEAGGNGRWYEYEYTIDKSLFAGDGRYIVTLYSEDVAGNVNENIDENKKAEISFGIDKTAPVVIPIDIASEEQYDMDVKTATVAVSDNLVLQNVGVTVGEANCEYTVDGEYYTFDIPSASGRQDIVIEAIDAAGNRVNYIISGVLVTTNAFIRLINNTPLLVGGIVGIAGLGGGSVAFIGLHRRRKYSLKMK